MKIKRKTVERSEEEAEKSKGKLNKISRKVDISSNTSILKMKKKTFFYKYSSYSDRYYRYGY